MSESWGLWRGYGFPGELYSVKYKAPGSNEIAKLVAGALDGVASVRIDERRGIDHAAWAPLAHLYPAQKIPVLELSIDINRTPRYHFELGRRLAGLRTERILVIGSGNIVHNLGEIDWNPDASPFEWAIEFDELVKQAILSKDFETLIDHEKIGDIATRSVPTNDHYLPMLYTLGMTASDEEPISFFHESIQHGSVSMRCFRIG
jgi:4,5-DOPA dioxygenase extradiol